MKKVRWGMVSAGRIANTFATDMQYVDNAEIVSVGARNLQAAQAFASQYQIPKAVEGYESIYQDPDIDAIYISTPHTFHSEQAIEALKHGKHVMCEKPLTVSVEECGKLLSAAEQHDQFLMEAMWTWFLPVTHKVREWVADGKIGELQHIQASFGFNMPYIPESREWDPKLGGGCLLDMGIYPLAYTWLFTKQQPKHIHSFEKLAPNGVERQLTSILNFDNIMASITTSFSCKLHNWAFLYGSDGYIAIPNFWGATKAFLYQGDDCVDEFVDDRVGSGFEFQIQHASQAILTGKKQSDVVTFQDSLAFQELMASLKKAAINN